MAHKDRVVVIGGTGFVGKELVSQLRREAVHVSVVSRSAKDNSGVADEYIVGDVTDRDRMMEVIRGATVVFQLTIEDDYVAAARNVADACLKHGVRRYIYTSTTNALDLSRRRVIREDEGADPKPETRNDYARGKALAEKLLLEYHRNQRLGVVIVRPALVVGRGGCLAHGGVGRMLSPTCLLSWGPGRNKMPFVLVRDVARGMALAMDTPGIEGKTFNFGGDIFLSVREYIDLLSERTLRNFRHRATSIYGYWALSNIKFVVKKLATSNGGERETLREIRSNAMFTLLDNSQSKSLLGWKPNADIDVFIREAIDCHLEPIPAGDLRLEAM